MSEIKPLDLLRRSDKWYLGGGNRLQFAPQFPLYLERPGFWDEIAYYNFALRPLYTWTLIDTRGVEIPLRSAGRTWDPSALTKEFHVGGLNSGLTILEEQSLLPNDVVVSTVTIRNTSRSVRPLHLIVWTVQEHYPGQQSIFLEDLTQAQGIFSFVKRVKMPERPELRCAAAFSVNRSVRSFAAYASEGNLPPPVWNLTPFRESFARGKLTDQLHLGGVTPDGVVYMALHLRLRVRPRDEAAVSIGMALGSSLAEAKLNLHAALRPKKAGVLSRVQWEEHFASVPRFRCSDPFLTRAYWYRWYGLRLNTIFGGEGNYEHPAVCEGIGYFRAPISYSTPCHMLENRWMHDPELARGSLLTFIHNQREDGAFRGYIDPFHHRAVIQGTKAVEPFYHARWGAALQGLDYNHPSGEFLLSAYEGLKRYAAYFDRERDGEVSGLYDIRNHYETGQEYMRRYLAVDPKADEANWGNIFRLKGVDATVYVYELKRELARIAERLGREEDAELWSLEAERTRNAVRSLMWDLDEEMFFDVDPGTGRRTGVKAATCFYPYFTDIVDETHLPGLKRHLLNPLEFWTSWPVPSSSADDPLFNAEPLWKGKRMNCPWNGRVWPMTNSHIAEALACSALRFNDRLLKEKTAEFINKYIRMMFFDNDPSRPNSFEHYGPFTGTPSLYRGVDDYQHSWIVDLIIKYICGIRPGEFAVTIDPLPFGLAQASIEHVNVRGRRLDVTIRKRRFVVKLDGERCASSTIGRGIELQI